MGMAAILVMNRDHFSNLSFPQPKKAQYEFEQIWLSGVREEVLWNSQQFSYSNVWGSYKCIGKQTWPYCKKSNVNVRQFFWQLW